LCLPEHCATCHLQCPPECRPRAVANYPMTTTRYINCQPDEEVPLIHRPCNHSVCRAHDSAVCEPCNRPPQPEQRPPPIDVEPWAPPLDPIPISFPQEWGV